ncbi:hypothetical protein V5799_004661, partial [Amblyomma americanum]
IPDDTLEHDSIDDFDDHDDASASDHHPGDAVPEASAAPAAAHAGVPSATTGPEPGVNARALQRRRTPPTTNLVDECSTPAPFVFNAGVAERSGRGQRGKAFGRTGGS